MIGHVSDPGILITAGILTGTRPTEWRGMVGMWSVSVRVYANLIVCYCILIQTDSSETFQIYEFGLLPFVYSYA